MKKIIITAVALFAAGAVRAATSGEFSAADCRASWDAKTLTVGNGLFSRAYAVQGHVLRTVSFKATGGGEWQKASVDLAKCAALEVSAEKAKWSPVGVEGVRVQVKFGERSAELWLFPNMPGVIVKRSWADTVRSVHDLDRGWESLKEDNSALRKAFGETDGIQFRPMHVKATDLTCLDQTDIRDNLVDANERLLMNYDWPFTIAASSLDCRDVLTGDGLVFVRLAPMPTCRPARVDDFILNGNKGVAPLANGYPLVELVYRGGEAGRQRAVIAFQRAIRPYRPGRDGVLLSNTWGAGNRDSRINQAFLLKEIEAGAKIGVDVIQIDDGWQHGRTERRRFGAAIGTRIPISGKRILNASRTALRSSSDARRRRGCASVCGSGRIPATRRRTGSVMRTVSSTTTVVSASTTSRWTPCGFCRRRRCSGTG